MIYMIRQLLVIGENGQLGRSINKVEEEYPQIKITFAGRNQLDLSCPESIKTYFSAHHFDYIINAAAYTAVDQAESEQQQADQINHQSVAQIARIAKQQSTILVQVSTEYVFDGNSHQPYRESDPANPINIYGETKWRGEQAMVRAAPQGCIVRTSWLYSEFGNNFVKTMLRLAAEREQIKVIFDQVGSPTYATDLARALLAIVEHGVLENISPPPIIFHYANEGLCSWYDFAHAIFELSDQSCSVIPIETKQYPTPAIRPHYSVMDKTAIKQQVQIQIPYWRSSLKRCINAIKSDNV
jgi:dTDP-4-dehydrorhamnose reductase